MSDAEGFDARLSTEKRRFKWVEKLQYTAFCEPFGASSEAINKKDDKPRLFLVRMAFVVRGSRENKRY